MGADERTRGRSDGHAYNQPRMPKRRLHTDAAPFLITQSEFFYAVYEAVHEEG